MSSVLPTLQLENITRTFQQAEEDVHVLKGVSLKIEPGEIVALVGSSGAGKTTLLQIAGLLESPTSGKISMAGQACESLDDQARTLLRQKYTGFVYQFHHLLPEFSALENVMLPQLIAGVKRALAYQKAEEILNRMGLSHRLSHRPKKLSGGEQQRVAIARALVNKPRILLADEPTGNLDDETAQKVFEEMMSLVRQTKLSALIATHNLELAKKMDKVVKLHSGYLSQI
ncbi:MAG: ABC transporter ATP-binding protein [Alphaproteobacteria bacterium]|nr:ABC transporter ATP-binding protein [Alphaproteobacteria bacterium]